MPVLSVPVHSVSLCPSGVCRNLDFPGSHAPLGSPSLSPSPCLLSSGFMPHKTQFLSSLPHPLPPHWAFRAQGQVLGGSAGPNPRSTTVPLDCSWGLHALRMASMPHPSRIENKVLSFYILLITVSKKVLQLPSYKNRSMSKLKETSKIISREVSSFCTRQTRSEKAWELAKVTKTGVGRMALASQKWGTSWPIPCWLLQ